MEWHQDPEQESRERDKERAEDLGLSCFDFIGREDERAVCRALGEFLSHRLHQRFVSPENVSALHSEIMPEMAWSIATSLSTELVQRAVQRLFDSSNKDLRADIRQVLSGTSMGTHEGLSMLCLGLQEDPQAVLTAARYRAAPFLESVSKSEGEDLGLPHVPVSSRYRAPSSSALLRDEESLETIRALGRIMRGALDEKLVTPHAVQALHPDIPLEMAEGCAYEISLSVVMARLRANSDCSPVHHSSLNQILGGTPSGRREALEALCRALDLSSAQVLQQARAEGAGGKK